MVSGLHERPVGGEIITEIEPLKEELARVIVEVAEVPACTAAGEVAEMPKSPTCKVTLNEWVMLPRELIPVMVAR